MATTLTSSSPASSRAVLLPVCDSDCCSGALRWALENVARPTDVFHLAYVVLHNCQQTNSLSPTSSLSSSPSSPPRSSPLPPPSPRSPPSPANSFCPEDSQLAARAELHCARAMIKRRFAPLLEEAGIPFEVHLLEPAGLTRECGGSRAEGVGGALLNLAAALSSGPRPASASSTLVVVGGGLKGSGASKRGGSSCGGSVTKYCLDRSPSTVCVVRGGGGGGGGR